MAPASPVKRHFVGTGKAIYRRAAAAVSILLLAFGMARFIFALSSELMDDGIVLSEEAGETLARGRQVIISLSRDRS